MRGRLRESGVVLRDSSSLCSIFIECTTEEVQTMMFESISVRYISVHFIVCHSLWKLCRWWLVNKWFSREEGKRNSSNKVGFSMGYRLQRPHVHWSLVQKLVYLCNFSAGLQRLDNKLSSWCIEDSVWVWTPGHRIHRRPWKTPQVHSWWDKLHIFILFSINISYSKDVHLNLACVKPLCLSLSPCPTRSC